MWSNASALQSREDIGQSVDLSGFELLHMLGLPQDNLIIIKSILF
jgi:hypothetical protein